MAYDEKKVLAVLAPHLDAAGLDLEQLKINNAGSKSSIAVVVDSDAGPTLDELAEVTRTLSAAVDDADDVFGGQAFTLEVTTPGAERPLVEPRHWRRARGRQAAIELTDGTNLLARIGPLTENGPDGGAVVTVVLPGVKGAAPTTRELALDEVAAAAVRVEFRRPNPKEMELSGITPGRVESGSEPVDPMGEDAGAAQNEDED